MMKLRPSGNEAALRKCLLNGSPSPLGSPDAMKKTAVLMIGTGEYTTGLAHGVASAADKSAGVIGTTLFDLRRRGKVGELLMAGTKGTRFPMIRDHLQRAIGDRYRGFDLGFRSFPDDSVESDPSAYRHAIAALDAGDAVTIFTPDDTHFEIAKAAMEQGCHVLIAKPLVKTARQHRELIQLADKHQVLVAMEVHKRWDPMYVDAKDRIRTLGGFSFFQSYMSQPKSQLETFRQWAGKSSDISYYLNSHHIDFHHWSVRAFARPLSVVASASTGVATSRGIDTEDTISLLTRWQNIEDGSLGTAVYTASWIAPKATFTPNSVSFTWDSVANCRSIKPIEGTALQRMKWDFFHRIRCS